MIKLLWKALFGRFSTKELNSLISSTQSSGVRYWMWKIYLYRHARDLSYDDIRLVSQSKNDKAGEYMVNSLARVSDQEEVAQKLPQVPLKTFQKLTRPVSARCLEILFEQNRMEKLFWYVKIFPLNVSGEIRLVKRAQATQNYPYEKLLNVYLQYNHSDRVFYYPEAQHALIGLGEKYAKVLIERFNVVYTPTEWILEDILAFNNERLIAKLLFKTVIESQKIQAEIQSRFPHLQKALEIADLRRRFRSNTMLAAQYGVCNVFNDEQKEMGDLLAVQNYKNQSLINSIMAENRFHSLSFLAWFLYRYPELQKQVPLRFYERFL